jgi:hypothetical protein
MLPEIVPLLPALNGRATRAEDMNDTVAAAVVAVV